MLYITSASPPNVHLSFSALSSRTSSGFRTAITIPFVGCATPFSPPERQFGLPVMVSNPFVSPFADAYSSQR